MWHFTPFLAVRRDQCQFAYDINDSSILGSPWFEFHFIILFVNLTVSISAIKFLWQINDNKKRGVTSCTTCGSSMWPGKLSVVQLIHMNCVVYCHTYFIGFAWVWEVNICNVSQIQAHIQLNPKPEIRPFIDDYSEKWLQFFTLHSKVMRTIWII